MFEKSCVKRAKVPVDSIPRAHRWLPDGAPPSGVKGFGSKRAGGVYAAVVQEAKMETLG